MVRVPAIVLLGLLAACSAAPDVEAVRRTPIPTVTAAPTPAVEPTTPATTVARTDEQANDEVLDEPIRFSETDSIHLLLTPEDVPGWDHVPAESVDGSLSRLTIDCDRMDALLRAQSLPAQQVRGSFDEATFSQRTIEMDNLAEAARLRDIVDSLPTFCRRFNDVEGRWTSNQLYLIDKGFLGTGLVLEHDDQRTYVVVWVHHSSVVMLEVEGPSAGANVHPLVAAIDARLTGQFAPAQPVFVPESERKNRVNRPDVGPNWEPEPEPADGPVETDISHSPVTANDQPWADHPLAGQILDPSDIGPGWTFGYSTELEPHPGVPDTLVCGNPIPPTPAGLRVDFTLGSTSDHVTVFQSVVTGTAEELQLLIDFDLALDGCSASGASYDSPITVADHDAPPGADASSIYFFNRGPINQGDLVETNMVGRVRYGNTLVIISSSGLNDLDPTTPIPTVEAFARLLAAAAPS